jgi:hypothetical protein
MRSSFINANVVTCYLLFFPLGLVISYVPLSFYNSIIVKAGNVEVMLVYVYKISVQRGDTTTIYLTKKLWRMKAKSKRNDIVQVSDVTWMIEDHKRCGLR